MLRAGAPCARAMIIAVKSVRRQLRKLTVVVDIRIAKRGRDTGRP
jgi:hypothetical protein